MSHEETVDVSNATEEDFKEWVREYRKIDKEIRDAGRLLTQMRKRRKELDTVILEWMQVNNVPSLKLGEDTLGRFVKTKLHPVNANYIGSVLEDYFKDTDQASTVTSVIFGNRPQEEEEILKITPAKKRKTIRPVGE